MNRLFLKKFWKVMSVVLATLLIILITVTTLGYQYKTKINSFLSLQAFKTVDEGDGTEDTEYFKSKFTSAKTDEVEAKKDIEQQIIQDWDNICRDLEGEGLVLLKNDNKTLPLNKTNNLKLSLFGTGSVNLNCSAQGRRSNSGASIDKEIFPTFKTALEILDDGNGKIEVNPSLWNFYNSGAGSSYGGVRKSQVDYIYEVPWNKYDSVLKESFSSFRDAAIVVLTRDATEGGDMSATGSDGANGDFLALSPEEVELLEQVTALKNNGTFKKVIVVLNAAAAIQLDFLDKNTISVDACLWIGNIGMSGIYSVAEALIGNIVPSGRLTDTFVKNNFSSPAMASWVLNEGKKFSNSWSGSALNDTQKFYGVYVEGIYVGYRYYETRYSDLIEGRDGVGLYNYSADVAYPFGSGLSYTNFDYDNFTVTESVDKKSYDVSVKVTNKGDAYSGKEVVQIYLQKPYTEYAVANMIETSSVELVGFAKTEILAPGENEVVKINVEKELFASYDVYGAETYILDSGNYYLTAGKNAHDAANNILAKKGYSQATGMDADGDVELVWNNLISEEDRDFKTYSVSSITGKDITNALEEGDINRYKGAEGNFVTYVSRNDWEGTWPTTATILQLTDEMISDLESNKAVESVGALPQFEVNNGLSLIMLRGKDYTDPDWDKLLDQLSFEELNKLVTGSCPSPATVSITKPELRDMDGPTFCKESFNSEITQARRFPCEGIWAATFNTELIGLAGEAIANDVIYRNYHGIYAPGANLHRAPHGGRTHEYFSEDPYLTGIAAEVEIKGIQKYGVIVYPKHFIFNDQEANRGGIGTWLNEQSAREIYIRPWKNIVAPNRGNAHSIMTSFNRMGCKWTSASSELINILRDEFGFQGFVLTDAADSNGASYMTSLDGVVAGTDMWLSTSGVHTLSKFKDNATVVNAMRNAAHRMLYNVCNYSVAMNGYSSTTRVVEILVWWEILLITLLVSFSVLFFGSATMLVLSVLRSRKRKEFYEKRQ